MTDASNVVIRRASAEDAPILLQLICALADFEALPRPNEAAQARLVEHGFGPQPKFEVFLAFVAGEPAGYTISFETYSTFLAQPTFYLEDLFVLPAYRKQKVGYALFQNCMQETVRRECGRMDWTVLDWNEHAIRFYDQLGGKHLKEWFLYRLTAEDLQHITAASNEE